MPMSRSYHSLDLSTMSAIAASLDLQAAARDSGAPYTVLEVNTVPAARRQTKASETASGDSDCKEIDVPKMVRRLRRDVQSLKEYVDQRHQYATIQYNSSNGHEYSTANSDTPRTFVQLIDSRGYHSVKHVFDHSSKPQRRLLWALILCVCLLMASYNLYVICQRFLAFPTHTTVHLIHFPNVEFPAVTVCNLNTFRLTSIVGAGLYGWFAATGANKRPYNFQNQSLLVDNVNISQADFFRRFGHRQKDFLYRCRWRNEQCTSDEFVPLTSPHGRCFTFSPQKWKRIVREPGQSQSLFLELNVEQYEYILATTAAVGVKVFVHRPGTDPSLSDGYVTVPIGKYTSIRIQRIKHQTLPPPYGDCVTPSTASILPIDGVFCTEPCDDPPHPDTELRTAKRIYSPCICKPECQSIEYKVSSSQAAIPSYGAADLTSSIEERARLERKFVHARDTYHRIDSIIYTYDMNRLNYSQTQIDITLQLAKKFRSNVSQFGRVYNSSSRSLLQAFRELRKKVKEKHSLFKLNSHVSFNIFVDQLITSLKDCLKMINNVVTSANSSSFDISLELDKIKNILEHLLGIGNHPQEYSSKVLEAIENGVRGFKRDLVDGFGQKYRELMTNREFYEKQILHILQIYKKLHLDINDLYGLITKTLTRIDTRDPPVNKHLRKTIPDNIKSIFDEVMVFKTQVHLITKKFLRDRDRIVNLYNDLTNITAIMDHRFMYVASNISTLYGIAMTIDESLENLHRSSADIAARYQAAKNGKTKMAKIFLSSHAASEWVKVKAICRRFSLIAENIAQSGMLPMDTVRTIMPRIIDFGLLNTPLSWLDFSPLTRDVQAIINSLASVVDAFESYSDELRQYVAGNRINSDFYRNNFLHMDIYVDELAEVRYVQTPSYTLLDFACDIGGTMALYLGVSLLALVDVVDMVLKYVTMKLSTCR